MSLYIGLLLLLIGAAGLYRWQRRNRLLFVIAAILFCLGVHYTSVPFIHDINSLPS